MKTASGTCHQWDGTSHTPREVAWLDGAVPHLVSPRPIWESPGGWFRDCEHQTGTRRKMWYQGRAVQI